MVLTVLAVCDQCGHALGGVGVGGKCGSCGRGAFVSVPSVWVPNPTRSDRRLSPEEWVQAEALLPEGKGAVKAIAFAAGWHVYRVGEGGGESPRNTPGACMCPHEVLSGHMMGCPAARE